MVNQNYQSTVKHTTFIEEIAKKLISVLLHLIVTRMFTHQKLNIFNITCF